ncbi:hypothetical protein [Zobellia sp. 1_MG-2023]|uniref:hypothetical protein n=1 Tax=Zobellia sp. 1_MG-2023 TaxID=3062626 RepID=UPI0026E311FC|nr:hypothetical protein [Zobellia sp. 1_MG-2023]MDO6821318.1 hypothetical protein [Zobellia sp. 1_MG-2023]
MFNSFLVSGANSMLLQHPIIDDITISPNYFITILSGVILALIFQFILTAVSVAAGVTSIGNLKKSYAESKANVEEEDDDSTNMTAGVKYTSMFGIWSLITTSIALFGATALALNINVIESSASNISTALVIWGLFFLILFYLETKVVGSLLGNLVTAITSGFKSSAGAITSMFETSPYQKADNVLDHTIDKVRSEFDTGMDSDKINSVMDNFFNKVDQRLPDIDQLKADMEDVAKQSKSKNSSSKWMAIQQMVTSAISENSKSSDPDKQSKAKKLQEAMSTISKNFNESDNSEEGVENIVAEFSSMDRQEINSRTQQIKEFLSKATPDEISGDRLNTLLKAAINHPGMIMTIISNQANGLDRESIINILSKNSNLKKEDINGYADKLENLFQSIGSQLNTDNEESLLNKFTDRVTTYFNSNDSNSSSLNFEQLGSSLQSALYNPKKSLADIKGQLSGLDLETVKSYITDNKYVDESKVNDVVATINNTKEQIERKVDKIETEARQRVKKLERKAVIQAEHARQTAVSAAWWLVITAILSGVAAIGGSVVALA